MNCFVSFVFGLSSGLYGSCIILLNRVYVVVERGVCGYTIFFVIWLIVVLLL